METHPIPQQISSYQFRLVGDMTLKQFFQVAGGCLVALLFYASDLNSFVKWLFILFFVILGLALAFVPLEDRPLERWILSFFRSIYTPTIYKWGKTGAVSFFNEEAPSPDEKVIAPQGEEKLNQYLSTPANPASSFAQTLENAEEKFLSGVKNLFFSGAPVKGEVSLSEKPASPLENVSFVANKIPQNIPTYIKPTVIEQTVPTGPSFETTKVSPVFAQKESTADLSQAVFSPDAAPPNPPSIPNTVTGQVIDQDSKILEGVIVEIRDSSQRPVRACKSNKLGHFMVVTPLVSGAYQIYSEKDGYTFVPVSFKALGEIIPPIAIKGKAIVKPKVETIQN